VGDGLARQLMDSVGREEDRTVCRYATVSQNTFLHITKSLARACVDLHVWTCLQHHGAYDLHAALGLAFQGVVLGLRGEGGSMDEGPQTPRASFFLFLQLVLPAGGGWEVVGMTVSSPAARPSGGGGHLARRSAAGETGSDGVSKGRDRVKGTGRRKRSESVSDQGSLVSELSGLVGALVSEYGRRAGAMSFLSEPAWPPLLSPSSSALAAAAGTGSGRCPASQQPYDGRQYDSRLQHAVASVVVLLPEECREAFGDVVLGALAACFGQTRGSAAEGE